MADLVTAGYVRTIGLWARGSRRSVCHIDMHQRQAESVTQPRMCKWLGHRSGASLGTSFHAAVTSTARVRAVSLFGTLIVSKPFLNSPLTFSASTKVGKANERAKLPYARSIRW